MSALLRLDAAIREAVRPDPLRTVWEWADACRILDTSTSAEPGRWRTERVPYSREIMDALSPTSPVERVVMMAGAQVSKTENGLNFIGSSIDDSPGPCLIIQPRDTDAENFSKMRLQKMINACPTLHAKIADSKPGSGEGTLTLKEFPGGVLKLTGAQAPAGLRSMPVRRYFFDEVDAAPDDCGGEGDPVELVDARTNTFANKKAYLCSTPTYAGYSKIEREFLRGDQRRYHVPCPHCGSFQLIEWARIKWEQGKPRGAWLECEHCQEKIENRHKDWMLPRGTWIPSVDPESCDPKIRSYHLSGLYSPHGWQSWGDIAVKFTRCIGDPNALRTWTNTLMGETWQAEGGKGLTIEALMAGRTGWGSEVPAGVAVVTAGVDTQDDRLEVERVGWGRGEENWSIDYTVLYGDTSKPAVWAELDELLAKPIPREGGGVLFVAAACIDSAGHSTSAVYDYVRTRAALRRLAIVGRRNNQTPRPIWNARPRRNNKGKIPLFVVGVDTAKEQIYGRLRIQTAGPGFCHFPPDRPEAYFKGLTIERFERKMVRGRLELSWHCPEGARNEPLDCRVYATAALHSWYALKNTIEKELDRLAVAADPAKGRRGPVAAPAKKASKAPGWFAGGGQAAGTAGPAARGWMKGLVR